MAGLGLLAAIWLGPLLAEWRQSFVAHMLAHMGVVALAAPLIALSFSLPVGRQSRWGSPVLLTPPRKGDRSEVAARGDEGSSSMSSVIGLPLAARDARRGSDRQREGKAASTLGFLPVLASLVELVAVWGWHAPAARAWVEASTAATVLEQASFLTAGLLLWLSCLQPGREAAGAFALLVTSVHMTLLGALLALSPRPLYGLDAVTCLGLTLTAGQDQQLGGVVMLVIGAVVYLVGGIWLLSRVLFDSSRLTGAMR